MPKRLLAFFLALGGAVSARAQSSESTRAWARTFAVEHCPRDCSAFEREDAEAQAKAGALPPHWKPTEHNRALAVRAEIAPRDADSCHEEQRAKLSALRTLARDLTCEQLLAIPEVAERCTAGLEERLASCRTQAEAARDLEARASAERARSAAAAQAALRKDSRLMLITYSAALCVYDEAHATAAKRVKVGANVAPLLEPGVVPDPAEKEARVQRVSELAARTKEKLLRDWKVPRLRCSDSVVAHVADCLWLSEFALLGSDHPGTLPAERCRDPLAMRTNRLGSLLELGVAAR